MKLDDLKQDWQKAIQTESAPENFNEVINMLEQETNRIDKEVKRRDFLEITIAILLIPAWVYGMYISVSTMQTIGCIVAIAASVYIPYRLLSARKVAAKKTDSIKDFLLQEKQKLLQQKQMLESIFWWYIGPITAAILLITLGSNVNESGWPKVPSHMVWYYVSVALLMIGVYSLNKRAAKKKFGPLLENIDKSLSEIN
ncbi:hypothetical protein AAD001_12515 [Colwelliaceae bacterium 6471]